MEKWELNEVLVDLDSHHVPVDSLAAQPLVAVAVRRSGAVCSWFLELKKNDIILLILLQLYIISIYNKGLICIMYFIVVIVCL